MKTILLAFVFLINISVLFGQKEIKINNILDKENADIDTLSGLKGKKIIFDVDTLYIINKFGIDDYIYCVEKLDECKTIADSLNNLSNNLGSIQMNVDSVCNNMRTLTLFINDFKAKNERNLDTLTILNKELSKTNADITKDLEKANQKIRNERWKSIGSKLIWGTGGFVLGTLFGVILTSL